MSKSIKARTSTVAISPTVAPEGLTTNDCQGEVILYCTEDGLKRLTRKRGGSDAH